MLEELYRITGWPVVTHQWLRLPVKITKNLWGGCKLLTSQYTTKICIRLWDRYVLVENIKLNVHKIKLNMCWKTDVAFVDGCLLGWYAFIFAGVRTSDFLQIRFISQHFIHRESYRQYWNRHQSHLHLQFMLFTNNAGGKETTWKTKA
jgi:hypothetical protein